MSELTKEYFDQKLGEQTTELKAFAREQTEELARMTTQGFDDVLERLDVRERMAAVEQKLHKIEEALHLTH